MPKDGIISIVMQVNGLSGYFHTINLSVRCCTLLGSSNDVPEPELEEVGCSASAEMLTMPWENWGPANMQILEHDSLMWGSLVGEQHSLLKSKLNAFCEGVCTLWLEAGANGRDRLALMDTACSSLAFRVHNTF
jgi:hypothetical protein